MERVQAAAVNEWHFGKMLQNGIEVCDGDLY